MSEEKFLGFDAPEQFNLAEHLLDQRISEGRGERTAVITDGGNFTYRDIQELANRFGNVLRQIGTEQENRIIISLPDIPEYVGAFFGILKIGAVVVMVNPQLKQEDIEYFLEYTRAKVAIVGNENYAVFAEAARKTPHLKRLLTVGYVASSTGNNSVSFEEEVRPVSA
ncbi:MAG TPA: AMP-binding protein, partial [Acidobacteriota bacterium]|nr:AMP-binding protein [Acidobacteriota bacterium]